MLLNDVDRLTLDAATTAVRSAPLLLASTADAAAARVRCYSSNTYPARRRQMSSFGCFDKMKERRTVGERGGMPQQMSRFRTPPPSRESAGCQTLVSINLIEV